MKNIKSLSIATIITIITVVILTLWAELSPVFKEFLKSITGHHWTTKSVFSVVIFFGIYFLLQRTDDNLDVMRESWAIFWVTILSSLVIFAFFIWHFFG